ncbi:MAG: hypothetical protein AMXMBFR64_59910 [Myxococcales bacterium]
MAVYCAAMTAPRAVLFDLGNVLCTVDVGRLPAAWEAATGAPYAALAEALFTSGLKHAMDRGQVGAAEVAARVSQVAGVSLDMESFAAIWGAVLLPWPAANALALRVTVPAGLLSNTDPMHHAYARSLCPALAALRPHVVSYAVGALKPEPAIYDAAVEAMGMAAGEILFLDDLEANVVAARAVGLRAEVVRDLGDLERALTPVLGPP